jgi:hypothetical protein
MGATTGPAQDFWRARDSATRLLKYLLKFDMRTLAGRRAMAVARRQERAGFFDSFGLNPPFLGPRHQHGGVENPPFRHRLELASDDGHPDPEIANRYCNYFTLKNHCSEQIVNGWPRAPPRQGRNAVLSISLS